MGGTRTAREATDGSLGDALEVVAEHLARTLDVGALTPVAHGSEDARSGVRRTEVGGLRGLVGELKQ